MEMNSGPEGIAPTAEDEFDPTSPELLDDLADDEFDEDQ
jgi:hypothetical protein